MSKRFYIIFFLLIFLSAIFYSCSKTLIITRLYDKPFYSNFLSDFEIKKDTLEILWSFSNSAGFTRNNFIMLDSFLIITDLKGDVKFINVFSGKKIGELSLKSPILGDVDLISNYLIIPTAKTKKQESYITYYNFLLGKTANAIQLEGSAETKILTLNNNAVFIQTDGTITKTDRIGNIIWEKKLKNNIPHNSLIIDKNIYCISEKGILFSIDFESGGINWQIQTYKPVSTALTSYNNDLYFGTSKGELICFDINNKKIKWSYDAKYKIIASPVIEGEFLYLTNITGDLIKLNLKNGLEISKYSGKQLSNLKPVIFKNRIFLFLQDKTIRIINKSDLTEIKKFHLEGRPKSEPFIFNDRLIIAIEDDLLICLKII